MQDRTISLIITVFPVIFMIMEEATPFSWVCPFYAFTNLPCPGCGMTRAVSSLIHLDLLSAISMHPFSPLIVFGWFVWGVIALLPSKKHLIVIKKIEIIEHETGIAYLFLVLFIAFGLARLLLAL
jgi:hypothetical protein